MDYWQKAPVSRKQQVLIAAMLDHRVPLRSPRSACWMRSLPGTTWTSCGSSLHGKLGRPPNPS